MLVIPHTSSGKQYTRIQEVYYAGFLDPIYTEHSPGVYHIGNFTVHCNSTICCKTNLNFALGIGNTFISNTLGDWLVGADNGTFECLMPAPNITSSAPSSPVTDYSGATRTFNITIDQPVNVSWLINGTVVKDSEKGVTEASYTNTSAVVGTWNVSAIVENANDTDMETWIWNVMAPPVLVNEFLVDNSSGAYNDWVELYNPTASAVNLTGWALNDTTSKMKSLSGSIAANGYLVVYVSNRLGNTGDTIILLNNSMVVDQVTYGTETGNAPVPPTDKSTGRYPNGIDTDITTVQISGSLMSQHREHQIQYQTTDYTFLNLRLG